MSDPPASPPRFHLKLRLVDATGSAFANHDFELTWGPAAPTNPPIRGKKTTAEGVVDLNVDAGQSSGTLVLGRLVGTTFTPKITIPLQKHQGSQDFTGNENLGTVGGYPASQTYTAYDIEWRLVNLLFLPHVPWRQPSGGGLPSAPTVPDETQDAVRRFKAANHAALGITNWLNGSRATLNAEQDDDTIKLILKLHDNLSDADAAAKLARHKSGSSWDPL